MITSYGPDSAFRSESYKLRAAMLVATVPEEVSRKKGAQGRWYLRLVPSVAASRVPSDARKGRRKRGREKREEGRKSEKERETKTKGNKTKRRGRRETLQAGEKGTIR